jgi:hypothetical protein
LLKDSLQGNSRTAMVATISAAGDQYHHSVNTLKYADRAKEIKTHVVKNVGSVERHITDYQNIIDNLQASKLCQILPDNACNRLHQRDLCPCFPSSKLSFYDAVYTCVCCILVPQCWLWRTYNHEVTLL